MPFGFFCPDCDKQLNESYRVNTIINVVTHGKPTNCAAVDTKIGQRRYYEDKHNQKNRDRVGAVAKNKQHHQDQSEKISDIRLRTITRTFKLSACRLLGRRVPWTPKRQQQND